MEEIQAKPAPFFLMKFTMIPKAKKDIQQLYKEFKSMYCYVQIILSIHGTRAIGNSSPMFLKTFLRINNGSEKSLLFLKQYIPKNKYQEKFTISLSSSSFAVELINISN